MSWHPELPYSGRQRQVEILGSLSGKVPPPTKARGAGLIGGGLSWGRCGRVFLPRPEEPSGWVPPPAMGSSLTHLLAQSPVKRWHLQTKDPTS